MIKRIDVKQGSEEWLRLRRSKVTVSDIPIIMGKSPYMSRERLLKEKKGEIPQQEWNASMRYGNEREAVIRDWFNDRLQETFQPAVVLHPDNDIFMASLDGVNLQEDWALEVKTCNEGVFRSCLLGDVACHHFLQIQAQLFCCDTIERAFYLVEWKKHRHHLIVNRDETIIRQIQDAGEQFYEEFA